MKPNEKSKRLAQIRGVFYEVPCDKKEEQESYMPSRPAPPLLLNRKCCFING